MKQRSKTFVLVGLGFALAAGIVVSIALGRYPIGIGELFGMLFSRVFDIAPFWEEAMETVLFNIRLPRVLMACMVGACLSGAGAAYQGIFRNPMASPDILGASSGAAFGAALAILMRQSSAMITLFAFVSSLVCVTLVMFVSARAHGQRVLAFVLSGIMIGSLFSAGVSFIKLVADPSNQLPAITYWLMGSLSGTKARDLLFALIPMTIGVVALMLLRWRINVLTLGDDEARSIGVDPRVVRTVVILASTLVTASAVSVSGVIGWIGLVIPHLARKLVGSSFRELMPASLLLGAIFMLLVDDVSRNLLSVEIPVGILTAFIGAPFFIFLMTRKKDAL